MRQLEGGITVDRGHRDAVAGSSRSSSSSSRREVSAGAWEESLGVWGVDDWELPGQGDSGPRCGQWYPEAVCSDCGKIDLTTHTCGRRSCGDCWGVWAKEAAVRAAVRVQGFRYTQPDDHRRQVAHAVWSPAEGTVRNEREFYEAKQRAASIAKEKGMRGFAVIPHPYRVKEATKERFRAADPDCGLWAWVRNEFDELEPHVYWSPHYHIVGATTADMDPGEESDEGVYKVIRTLGRFEGTRDTESHEEVYGLFRYLLSHAGYPGGSARQVTTWHGELANSVFVEEATEDWQVQKPSEDVMSTLQQEIEQVAGAEIEDEEDGAGGGDEREECPLEECEGVLIDVFDLEAYMRQREPPPGVADRMKAAVDYRLGRRSPPPGLKNPQTEEQAQEAISALLPEGHEI